MSDSDDDDEDDAEEEAVPMQFEQVRRARRELLS